MSQQYLFDEANHTFSNVELWGKPESQYIKGQQSETSKYDDLQPMLLCFLPFWDFPGCILNIGEALTQPLGQWDWSQISSQETTKVSICIFCVSYHKASSISVDKLQCQTSCRLIISWTIWWTLRSKPTLSENYENCFPK